MILLKIGNFCCRKLIFLVKWQKSGIAAKPVLISRILAC
jgi:hypothetical protein